MAHFKEPRESLEFTMENGLGSFCNLKIATV